MRVLDNFVTPESEADLMAKLEPILAVVPRRKGQHRSRVIRFGFDYEHPGEWLGDIPDWLCLSDADSVTVNEYLHGQSIAPHVDSTKFGDVMILSLLADVLMRFTDPNGLTRDFLLTRRSLATLPPELRSTWKHSTLPLDAPRRISIIYRRKIT